MYSETQMKPVGGYIHSNIHRDDVQMFTDACKPYGCGDKQLVFIRGRAVDSSHMIWNRVRLVRNSHLIRHRQLSTNTCLKPSVSADALNIFQGHKTKRTHASTSAGKNL